MLFHNRTALLFAVILAMLQILLVFSEGESDGDGETPTSPAPFPPKSLTDAGRRFIYRGSPGLPGVPGRDGRDGRDATLRGPPGEKGEPGPRGRKGDRSGITGGVVYTRWGRTQCPTGSSLIYSGVMGGSYYSHSGSGSNYLCLPNDPIYDGVKPGRQNTAFIYGTEYQTGHQENIMPGRNDHDAPCAVCQTESRISHVMIPARNVCPGGWTKEYKGYLMATYHTQNHFRTQYICVDGDAEVVSGTQANHNGAVLYFVEGACGSLPCKPYVDGYELTCVVCTM